MLYPPPSYHDLSLPAITEEEVNTYTSSSSSSSSHNRVVASSTDLQQLPPPSPTPRLAFASPGGVPRRFSAPSSGSCPVGVHRHSIAIVADSTLPCGVVRSALAQDPDRRHSATARWLQPIMERLSWLQQDGSRRQQVDHPYYTADAEAPESGTFDESSRRGSSSQQETQTTFTVTSPTSVQSMDGIDNLGMEPVVMPPSPELLNGKRKLSVSAEIHREPEVDEAPAARPLRRTVSDDGACSSVEVVVAAAAVINVEDDETVVQREATLPLPPVETTTVSRD